MVVSIMVRLANKDYKPFREEDVRNRELVIRMLKHEEKIIRSDEGQARYANPLNEPYISLTNEYAFNRATLTEFGFDTSDESVENYRTIFRTYFRSPDDYDKEVIDSVHYMRNNRCVFYKAPLINKGGQIPDVRLYNLDGKTETTLHQACRKGNPEKTLVCAFSNS